MMHRNPFPAVGFVRIFSVVSSEKRPSDTSLYSSHYVDIPAKIPPEGFRIAAKLCILNARMKFYKRHKQLPTHIRSQKITCYGEKQRINVARLEG